MHEPAPSRDAGARGLDIRDLHVRYGLSHALQGVSLELAQGVHAVVGRNGMGKTTLCNAVMGLLPIERGSVRFRGRELAGLPPHRIARAGIGYTPQGRRLWPSLTVDEHLRLVWSGGSAWTVDRVYDSFPRLAERRRNGGGQLSGGEQQLLAIARALLQDPELLVLDEPTEGLAPVVVDQVERLLAALAADARVAVLLIEQNVSVATAVADRVSIMVNGRLQQTLPAGELAADRSLQERLLGVGRHAQAELPPGTPDDDGTPDEAEPPLPPVSVLSTEREGFIHLPPTRWTAASWRRYPAAAAARGGDAPGPEPGTATKPLPALAGDVEAGPVLVAGTFDTKGVELRFLRDRLSALGVRATTVDLSTSGAAVSAHAFESGAKPRWLARVPTRTTRA